MQEFLRVGYYVNVEYEDEEMKENPPDKPVVAKYDSPTCRATVSCGTCCSMIVLQHDGLSCEQCYSCASFELVAANCVMRVIAALLLDWQG